MKYVEYDCVFETLKTIGRSSVFEKVKIILNNEQELVLMIGYRPFISMFSDTPNYVNFIGDDFKNVEINLDDIKDILIFEQINEKA